MTATDINFRIGERLVASNEISADQLQWVLRIQNQTQERLGEILVARGLIRRTRLYQVLAETWGIPFVDLYIDEPDAELVRRFSHRQLMREGWIPVRQQGDTVLVAVLEDPSAKANRITNTVRTQLGPRVRVEFAAANEWEIQRRIGKIFYDMLLDEAVLGLVRRDAAESAHTVFTRGQFVALGVTLLLLVWGFAVAPLATFILLNVVVNVGFAMAILFKFGVAVAGARQETVVPVTDAEVAALTSDKLPTYTILVPAYREENVVGLLMRNLGRLDYPPEKLQILLLLEEDDDLTLDAAKAARPPETVRFVIVPNGLPKTKPKACNVGMFYATGDYLVIYDAEDEPDPDQLKKAVVAFEKGPDHQICVQAALNYFNADENVLTRMFTLEYSFWFDYMLPGLDLLDLPIPLGGTSNHFRVDALRHLGGWDPFNVTEDADLGVRSSAEGYSIGVINSTTYEEANRAPKNWIRQRSRWIKGYMQTALVHMRNPMRLVRAVGPRRAAGFLMLIGGTPLTFLFVPILWTIFFSWLGARLFDIGTMSEAIESVYPPVVLYVSLFNLLIGNALMVYLNMLAVFKRRLHPLIGFSVLNPAYWIMHSIASYMALWELFTRPFHWQKTQHGISRHTHAAGAGPAANPGPSSPGSAH